MRAGYDEINTGVGRRRRCPDRVRDTRRDPDGRCADLTLDFGVAKDGTVMFVTVVRSSGYPVYDDVAINAVKLAAPFEPVPDAMSVRGIVIRTTMRYVDTPDLPPVRDRRP